MQLQQQLFTEMQRWEVTALCVGGPSAPQSSGEHEKFAVSNLSVFPVFLSFSCFAFPCCSAEMMAEQDAVQQLAAATQSAASHLFTPASTPRVFDGVKVVAERIVVAIANNSDSICRVVMSAQYRIVSIAST
jgi:hypothetical protein